jgi:hypothetical protein
MSENAHCVTFQPSLLSVASRTSAVSLGGGVLFDTHVEHSPVI